MKFFEDMSRIALYFLWSLNYSRVLKNILRFATTEGFPQILFISEGPNVRFYVPLSSSPDMSGHTLLFLISTLIKEQVNSSRYYFTCQIESTISGRERSVSIIKSGGSCEEGENLSESLPLFIQIAVISFFIFFAFSITGI